MSIKCERSISSALYSLQIGHGYFRSYLYRFHKVNSDRCRCGGRETPEHLLLACPLYNSRRPASLRTARRLDTLLSSPNGLNDTIEYLRKTKIATRSWYLHRTREFDKEDDKEGGDEGDEEFGEED